jgi:uncharacterized protein (TIGR00251 family)
MIRGRIFALKQYCQFKFELGKEKVSSENNICLKVKVQPRARQRKVQKTGEKEYTVRVLSPPAEGRANKEVIEALASHFHLPPSRVKILKGKKSRQKIVILEDGA